MCTSVFANRPAVREGVTRAGADGLSATARNSQRRDVVDPIRVMELPARVDEHRRLLGR